IPDEDMPVNPGQQNAPAGACTSNITLLSTVIAPKNPDLSLATIQDKNQNPPQITVLQVGEPFGDAKVSAVYDEYDEENLAFVSSLELTHAHGRKELCKSTADAPGAGVSVASQSGGST